MPTPSTYYEAQRELDYVRALAFQLLMSDEVASIDGPFARKLADEVFDQNEGEALEAIQNMEAVRTAAE